MNDRSILFNYELDARRRSVDTGGLALALERATRAICVNGDDVDGVGVGHFGAIRMTRLSVSAPGQNGGKSTGDRKAPDDSLSRNDGQIRATSDTQCGEDEEDGKETVLAELLCEMYRQTRIAIEITMADYPM
jgi:hypothetical protein